MQFQNKILICGIGNPLRSDDGVGAWIVAELDKLAIANAVTDLQQQLHAEMIEYFLTFKAVLLVDASIKENFTEIKPVTTGIAHGASSSHHLNVETLNALSVQLYGKTINLWTCSIPAQNFEMGEQFSARTLSSIPLALQKIKNWINSIQ